MRLIEAYLFRQLAWPALGALAALGGVALITQTLGLLDVVVDQHQNAAVFLKVVLLSLPSMTPIVTPIALFVAALWALNRLYADQELVVCFGGGLSLWRVTAPAWRLATLVTLFILVSNLFIQPLAMRARAAELFRIRTDLAATLVHDGEFAQPSPGLTVYAQNVDDRGRLKNVFIHEAKSKGNGQATTFTGQHGLITKQDGRPVLILMQGSNQSFSDKGVLNFLAFDEYVFDLTPYLNTTDELHFKPSDRYLHELVKPDQKDPWQGVKKNRKDMKAEANGRLSSPLYALTFMALALQAVLGGGFSRTGYGRRIAIASGTAAAIRILGFAVQSASASTPTLAILQYLVPLVPLVVVCWRLYRRPRQGSSGVKRIEITPLGGPVPAPA